VRLTTTGGPEDLRRYSSLSPGEGELLGRLRAVDRMVAPELRRQLEQEAVW